MKRIISYRLISVSLRFYVSVCAYACVPACVCMCACLLCGPIDAFNFITSMKMDIFHHVHLFVAPRNRCRCFDKVVFRLVSGISTSILNDLFVVENLLFFFFYSVRWMRIKIGTVDSKWIITAHSCCHSLRTMSIEIMSRITIFLHRKFPTTLCCC